MAKPTAAKIFQDCGRASQKIGGAEDFSLGKTISAAAPEKVLNLCGATTLPEMIEWVRRCDLLITNDTGPMATSKKTATPSTVLQAKRSVSAPAGRHLV
jgi:ADP-heptose:LPS heptosyltransferase